MNTSTINTTDPIDTDAVAKGLAAKSYITELQSNDNPPDDVPCLISNINDYLNDLAAIAPKSEYFASNGIVTSIGYYIVNALLWQYRAAQAKPKDMVMGDICDDGFDYPADTRASGLADAGLPDLPKLDALALMGVYKMLFQMQRGSVYHADYPTRTPNEIVAEMIMSERERELNNAYTAMANSEIAASRGAAAIQHQMVKRVQRKPEFTDRNKAEMAYVIDTLKKCAPEEFTDEAWKNIPAWIQYKLAMTVFNQLTKAVAMETVLNPTGSYLRTTLIDMVDVMMLELTQAGKHPDVKLAFALGRLNERHVIETTAPVVPAQVDEPVAQFKRAPAPAPVH